MNEKWGWAAAIVAAAVLAYVIVDRLDNQALAVLTGAVCGALAGVPITAVTFWLIRRERNPQQIRRPIWQEPPPPQAPPPQVIVIQQPPAPPPAAGLAPWQSSGAAFPSTRPPRNFNIVGDEEEEDGTS
jgi:hypothetical protein